VRGLSKDYTIRHNATDHITVAELALDRIRHPLRRAEREQFQALRDVSFDLHVGEILGLIGRNGAGKSTLLKVLGRVTEPSAGEVRVWGRVGSLLEVGTGFHPELTGRENVYLNGSILGMSKKEIGAKFDAIVDFAGVEKFLDTPVKRFSSGMYVRLAFAVAAHLDTEILLLDEVLAVGDGDFQAKCLGKVSDLAHGGRAVILVSHNMTTVRHFTSHALLLQRGALVGWGPTEEVVSQYIDSRLGAVEEADVSELPRYDATLGRRARITKVVLNHAHGILDAEADLSYSVTIRANEELESLRIAQTIRTTDGQSVGTSFSPANLQLGLGVSDVEIVLPLPRLAPGQYALAVALKFGDTASSIVDLDYVSDAIHFEAAAPVSDSGRLTAWNASWGNVRFPPLQMLHVETRLRA
jgi:lipopolysaccharide transport system ATP-binding protein